MQWSEAIDKYIKALAPVTKSPQLIQRIYSLVDLTTLNKTDTNDSVAALCEKAQATFGHVAAVCIYPEFVRLAASTFAGTPVKVATVVNFPEGESSLESVLIDINNALQDGAQEIDVVFPYMRYLAGEKQYAHSFIASCKAACGDNVLKVILETGALQEPVLIAEVSYEAFTAGADFIKTSTGKIPEGATLEAAATMLLVVQHLTAQLKRPLGVKISGGVRELQQAAQYVELADAIMGHGWAAPETFRIGASKLVDEMLKEMA